MGINKIGAMLFRRIMMILPPVPPPPPPPPNRAGGAGSRCQEYTKAIVKAFVALAGTPVFIALALLRNMTRQGAQGHVQAPQPAPPQLAPFQPLPLQQPRKRSPGG